MAEVARAMRDAGETPTIQRLRERGVTEAALRLAVVMDFGDGAARFDAVMPDSFIVGGTWQQANRHQHRFEADSMKALEDAIQRLAPPDGTTIVRKCFPGNPRLELTRALERGRRYVEITEISDPGLPWRFGILFGEYGGPDDTDGRRGGDLAYVAAFVRAWLVELRAASELSPTA